MSKISGHSVKKIPQFPRVGIFFPLYFQGLIGGESILIAPSPNTQIKYRLLSLSQVLLHKKSPLFTP